MGGKRLLKLFMIIGVLGLVVSCAKRQVERAREDENHLSARRGLTGLDITDVPRRNLGFDRELLLAHSARGTPLPKQRPEA